MKTQSNIQSIPVYDEPPSVPSVSPFLRGGDILDLSMDTNILRENSYVYGDTLTCITEGGSINFEGVGNQITLMGGIDNALAQGGLSMLGSFGGKG